MQDVYTRKRKRYAQKPALDSDDKGDQFAEWLTATYLESYAGKIADYCRAHKNCKSCHFYIGTCRLNRYPSDWDMKDFDFTT